MNNKYRDLIKQTFEFPQNGFSVQNNELFFYDIPLMEIVEKYGTPLKVFYRPEISKKILEARSLFNKAMEKNNYRGDYKFCYCTKSSHFSFVLDEVMKQKAHIETSSAYDIPILRNLQKKGKLDKSTYIICNGFKRPLYTEYITDLVNDGYNVIPILDNVEEAEEYKNVKKKVQIGLRVASEETPTFEFYSSRLGIPHADIKEYYLKTIKPNEKFSLKMLHFFINTGIRDTAYYWSELLKVLNVYCELKKVCPSLSALNIGGGFPVANSLNFKFDYQGITNDIIKEIKSFCLEKDIPEPDIFTEFGTYTVGTSGINIYSVIGKKAQNDRELWYMTDNSFITTLPDTWGIDQRHIMLPLNHWDKPYKRVNLGGLTCDSQDYYNSEVHLNQVYLPENKDKPLYIGFFNTGAYQEALSGYGGIKHCLIPSPKIVILDKNKEGNYSSSLFRKEQDASSMLKLLGYTD